MNSLFIRVTALLLHAIANFVLVSYLLNYDLTGKWVTFAGFVVLIFVLVYLFIRHIVSFIYFVKTKTK
jgi:hypothetical protein